MTTEKTLYILIAFTWCICLYELYVIAKQRDEIQELRDSNTRLFLIKDVQFRMIRDLDSTLKTHKL